MDIQKIYQMWIRS